MAVVAPDVVYPFKLSHSTVEAEELRYSLRSLANLPHGRVWIVGERPDWVRNVEHIPVAQNVGKFHNLCANLKEACLDRRVSDPFVVFNADFFVTQPVDEVLPHHRPETVDEAIARYTRQSMTVWRNHMARVKKSFGAAISYELHIPMPVEKGPMLVALARGGVGPCWRTAYAAHVGLGGAPYHDVKVNRPGGDPDKDAEYASGSDRAFASDKPLGMWIRSLFPEPCEYEHA